MQMPIQIQIQTRVLTEINPIDYNVAAVSSNRTQGHARDAIAARHQLYRSPLSFERHDVKTTASAVSQMFTIQHTGMPFSLTFTTTIILTNLTI